ncbi:hypothetical protein RFI_29139 [Reticulomyxa filosa]|uniref:Uncharacterized protein n=1 Tax=Reticulomyxa filosa TaxID=46433 RepID=X6M3P8_RETFI|nr:hypothetical protein RFI_29139 [Reticulomyxa filosa]|eukprot:ETO08251.1 hypothetical protein RFI_29139 [Reticulomyxa filosa]
MKQGLAHIPILPSLFSFLDIMALPNLPTRLFDCQSVLFKNELIICGGNMNDKCYSYHLEKREYKWICDYPKGTVLRGHTVISIKNDNETTTLLSFGGGGTMKTPYHTFVMYYRSVWTDESNQNKWIPFPGNILLGKKQGYNLFGARAAIGGSKRSLLFIVHPPQKMEVLDVNSLTPTCRQKMFVPSCSDEFNCLVGYNPTTFILMAKSSNIMVRLDEERNMLFYKQLPTNPFLDSCWGSACVLFNHFIITFGGCGPAQKFIDSVFLFNIKLQCWYQLDVRMPFPIVQSVAVLHSSSHRFSVHIIGGRNTQNEALPLHWMLSQVFLLLFIIF